MAPNDVTIDIPLQPVVSHASTGARRVGSTSPMNPAGEQGAFAAETPVEKGGLFHRGIAGRRQKHKGEPTGHTGYDGEEDTITRMGKIYSKILNFSIVTRYFIYVLPLALAIAIPIIIGATVAKNAKIDQTPMWRFFTWIEVVWLSVWCAKIVAHFLPSAFEFFAGVVSSGTRKYALVINALQIPLSLVGWAAASLASFNGLVKRDRHWQSVINLLLSAALASACVFLAQKFLIQLISINYHRKQFNAKIKESKRNIFLLGLLYDASRSLFPAYCSEFAEEDYIINDALNISLGSSKKGSTHNRSGSATPMRLIQDVGRFGDKITSAFGGIAQEITGKKVFDPTSAHSIVVEALEKNRSCEALAKRLWMSFVVEGKNALYAEDIAEVLGAGRQAEAEECFAALDRDGNGDISLDEMVLTVTEIGRERRSIATSMHDVDQAINVLDGLLATVVFIVTVFIFIAFLNRNFVTTLATAGTALLSLSFVFAVTCQEVLGSCIFLFVKHPYDIGDRIDIKDDQMTVEHISLLFTVFRRVATGRMVQIPNIVLNGLWIENVSRSKAMREQITVAVNFDTTFEDIKALRNEMQNFVLDKDNCRDFQPDIDVEVIGIAEMNKLELRVEIRHKSNWANETVRAARRSKFMCALVLALRKIPIYGPGAGDAALGSEGKPTYSVAIAEEVAEAQRKKFADEKEAKRLFPSKKAEEDAEKKKKAEDSEAKSTGLDYLSTAREASAVEKLTQRPPAIDVARDDWGSRDENSTLGERTSTERQDLDEVRGLLRRESTRGKRKAGPEHLQPAVPGVPTIPEPPSSSPFQPQIGFQDYAQRPAVAPPPAPYQVYASAQQPQQSGYMPQQSGYASQQASTTSPVGADEYSLTPPGSQQQQGSRPPPPRAPGQGQGNAFAQPQGQAQQPWRP
ncbi:hypothetical protein H2199_000498 [Coniosporium tulheliwenetii]|nr:hypothetical protein H2199_000498 [Cladosporium sp. JES 115]